METQATGGGLAYRRKSVTVAFIDFKKAFDSVAHNKLFFRFAQYGIRGELLSWLKQFFSKRAHQTTSISKCSVLNVSSRSTALYSITTLMAPYYQISYYHITPRPSQKGGGALQIFGPYLLWSNGWMDQDSAWHGDRPQPRRLCVKWGPSPPLIFGPCIL